MRNQFEKFKRARSSEAELRDAAALLGEVVEPPSFWSAIANDASMPVAHRKLAVVALVRRHLSPGMTVGAFADLLDGAPWLGDDDVAAVTGIFGKVPVSWGPDDTVVAIALPGGSGAIYLAITGRFAAAELATALRGSSRDERVLAAAIRDVGIEVDGRAMRSDRFVDRASS